MYFYSIINKNIKNPKSTKFTLAIALLYATVCSAQTLTLQPGPEGRDAYVLDKYPTVNYESYPNFESEAWTNGGGFIGRCLIEFDLAGLPAGATIVSATLSLYYAPQMDSDQHSTLSGSNACFIQRVTDSWDETLVTWNNQPATTTSNQASLAQSISNTQDYTNIDVKAML